MIIKFVLITVIAVLSGIGASAVLNDLVMEPKIVSCKEHSEEYVPTLQKKGWQLVDVDSYAGEAGGVVVLYFSTLKGGRNLVYARGDAIDIFKGEVGTPFDFIGKCLSTAGQEAEIYVVVPPTEEKKDEFNSQK